MLGNQDIGDMMYTDQYSVENVNDEKGYVWSYKGNPNLTWERTSTIDLGLEFSIGKYLDVEFDYFYKKTDNMLFPRYVAPSLGYGGYYVNDAAMMMLRHIIQAEELYENFEISVMHVSMLSCV